MMIEEVKATKAQLVETRKNYLAWQQKNTAEYDALIKQQHELRKALMEASRPTPRRGGPFAAAEARINRAQITAELNSELVTLAEDLRDFRKRTEMTDRNMQKKIAFLEKELS